jgi:hypothetical protein
MQIPFVGQAYQSRSVPVSAQVCINWYPEVEPQDARAVIVLQSASGIQEFANIGVSDVDFIRGMRYSEQLELLFVVSGSTLYKIDANSSITPIAGTIAGSSQVAMSDNGYQVGIATGTSYQLYNNATNVLSTVLTSGAENIPARDIGFLDGRFILMTEGQRFYITSPNAGETVNALDFSDVEGNPDALAGMLVANRRIWFFGTDSFDVYFNSVQLAALGDFPIARVDGAMKNGFGLCGLFGKVAQDDICYWCSNDGRIYRMNGYTPERISHYGVENMISTYPTLSDCQANEWTENGHRFVSFSFPSGNATWVYDISINMWHQRASGLSLDIWDAGIIEECWDKRTIVGSRSDDILGELNSDIFTEYGESMKCKRTTAVIHSGQNQVFTSRLELVMEAGKSQSGEDAKVGLRWSNDGGFTWGNWLFKSLGEIGEYYKRVVWYCLGASVARVYDVEITDNVPRTLIDCVAEIELGDV